MPKFLARIVSLLLVACLITEPGQAAILARPPAPQVDSGLLSDQALAVPLVNRPGPLKAKVVVFSLLASVAPTLFAQGSAIPDIGELMKTIGVERVLARSDNSLPYEIAVDNWIQTTQPQSLEDRARVREAALGLFVDTEDPMTASRSMNRLLQLALDDVDQDPATTPWALAEKYHKHIRGRISGVTTPAKEAALLQMWMDALLVRVPEKEGQRVFLVALYLFMNPDFPEKIPGGWLLPITPENVTVTPVVPPAPPKIIPPPKLPFSVPTWLSRVIGVIGLFLGAFWTLGYVDAYMPPKGRGSRPFWLLGVTPIVEELPRAFVWWQFGMFWTGVFSAILVFAQWFLNSWKAINHHHVNKKEEKKNGSNEFNESIESNESDELDELDMNTQKKSYHRMANPIRAHSRREILALRDTTLFPVIAMLLAMFVFWIVPQADPRFKDLWLIPASVNWFVRLVMGVVWMFVFSDNFRSGESAVISPSLFRAYAARSRSRYEQREYEPTIRKLDKPRPVKEPPPNQSVERSS